MDILEKYKDMTEEEFNELPQEEQERIKAEVEAEAKAMAAGITDAFNAMSEEEKENLKQTMKESQEFNQRLYERTKDYTEAEIMADMMNPETEGYTEEELEMAKNLIKDPEYYIKHPPKAQKHSVLDGTGDALKHTAKRGIMYAIKSFIRGIFS